MAETERVERPSLALAPDPCALHQGLIRLHRHRPVLVPEGTVRERSVDMDPFTPLLDRALLHTPSWVASLGKRPVRPTASLEALKQAFGGDLPESGQDPLEVVDLLARAGEPGLMATAGPRFFGFVIGGRSAAAVSGDCVA